MKIPFGCKIAGLLLSSLAYNSYALDLPVKVIDNNGNPIQDVVVQAIPTDKALAAKLRLETSSDTEIDQVNKTYQPLVSVITQGSSVNFINKDKTKHHVYSFSPTKKFEIKLYKGKPSNSILFEKSGAVTIGCNIHDWMVGYINIVNTPYYGKTNEAGLVQLKDLVATEYNVKIWHPGMKRTARTDKKILLGVDSEELVFKLKLKAEKMWMPGKPKRKYSGKK